MALIIARRYATARLFRVPALIVALVAAAAGQGTETFSNPIFKSQDPWVTRQNGVYYYSDSEGDAIRVRTSRTLTGLADAFPQTVWMPRWSGAPLTNVWAPEIHFLDGRWYIYYSADIRGDRRHRMYVLAGGTEPWEAYRPADTGRAYGLLPESTNRWAIDPNVFRAADDRDYLTWSCAESEIGAAPQAICLAPLADPLHVAGPTVRISTPNQPWELRTAAIQEGPTGFTRDGRTFITYSGSASWTTNDYSVGLLTNSEKNVLSPAAWTKSGPIFDHHGRTWGPGSVVFTPSPDGTEVWSLFHAYDAPNCPNWSCRSIRMQPVAWDESGPVLGYPLDPGIRVAKPSGDSGSPTGWSSAPNWTLPDPSSADAHGLSTDEPLTTLRRNSAALAWDISVSLGPAQFGQYSDRLAYGLYPAWNDAANYALITLEPKRGLILRTVTRDNTEEIRTPFPPDFDPGAKHQLRASISGTGQLDAFIDDTRIGATTLTFSAPQVGLFARSADVSFRDLTVTDRSYGWTGSSGTWDLKGPDAASARAATTLSSVYRGNPNLTDYTVQTTVTPTTEPAADSSAGLVVCYSDPENNLTLWLNSAARSLELISVVGGISDGRVLAYDVTPGTHILAAAKSDHLFTFWLDGVLLAQQSFDLSSGHRGITTRNTQADFTSFGPIPPPAPEDHSQKRRNPVSKSPAKGAAASR